MGTHTNLEITLILMSSCPASTSASPTTGACKALHGGYDPSLVKEIKEGDIFVAGKILAAASSREGAPVAIRSEHILCYRKSFARIFIECY